MRRRYSRRFWLALAAVLVLTTLATLATLAQVLLDGTAGRALTVAVTLGGAVPVVLAALWQRDEPAARG
ncbi:hypothetical protein Q5530_31175 [Saccharothrix sp. BKS2]|uniref:hypothetical protein n=1 Tax=Saccharothrix sp. BKS2 TaxID=3064400 RepID=UPI0039E81CC7